MRECVLPTRSFHFKLSYFYEKGFALGHVFKQRHKAEGNLKIAFLDVSLHGKRIAASPRLNAVHEIECSIQRP